MAMFSRVKVLRALVVLTILILPLSILAVTSAPARAATQSPCRFRFVPSPNVGSGDNALGGVATIGITNVWAVGEFATASAGQTLVEHWNGASWSVMSSPNVGSGSNFLDAVSADSSTDVWAVGGFGSAGTSQTLVEHWNGVSWSVVSSPSPGSSFNVLYGVTAVSSNDVWAVGTFSNTSGPSQTLIEHWNGVSWSVVSSFSPGSSSNELRGVAADATNDVWAVGILSNTGGSSLTLIEHWDGVSWSLIPGVTFGSSLTELFGVTSLAPINVWAVGILSNTGGSSLTLIEHWNGVSWSVSPAVNFGSALTELFGVATIAPNDVWAVGDFQNTGANQFVLPLTEHWNGASWSVVPNPAANIPGFGGNLHGVAAANSHKVWTVGEESNNTTIDQTLAEHWTPVGWQVLNNPPIGTNFSFLRAVSARKTPTPLAFAWAVGAFLDNGASSQTLTELIVCSGA